MGSTPLSLLGRTNMIFTDVAAENTLHISIFSDVDCLFFYYSRSTTVGWILTMIRIVNSVVGYVDVSFSVKRRLPY